MGRMQTALYYRRVR